MANKANKPNRANKIKKTNTSNNNNLAVEDNSVNKKHESDREVTLKKDDFYDTSKEHATFLKVKDEYENYKRKRISYKRYGSLFIVVSGIIFLTLMFSLESKIEFLILWVISCFYCAALMIRADYKYHKFATLLGLDDED